MPDYTTTTTGARLEDDERYPKVMEGLVEMVKKIPNLPNRGALLADLQGREEYGIKKYGVPLRVMDGNDALKESYQEAIDGGVYAVQALIEAALTPDCPVERGLILSDVIVCYIRLMASLRSILDNRDDPSHPEPYTTTDLFMQEIEVTIE